MSEEIQEPADAATETSKFKSVPMTKEMQKAEFDNEQKGNLAEALQENQLYFDGDRYWSKLDDDRWVADKKEDAAANIRQKFKLFKPDYVEQVLYKARMNRRVDGVFPFIHNKQTVVRDDSGASLNISRRKLLAASPEPGDFPWLKTYFDNIFDPTEPKQRDIFLAWFQRLYVSAHEGALQAGQAVIIAGHTGLGKTLISRRVVGAALGGFTDAGSYLTGKTEFNKEAAETAVWSVDDNRGGATWEKHDEFANALKRYVANPQIPYHPKFKDATTVTWRGRIVVTCNLDDKSLSILPELDDSITDKLLLFKCGDKFMPCFKDVETVIAKELPFFLHWLLRWTPPAFAINGDERFKIVSYQHPDLVLASFTAASDYQLLEMLRIAVPRNVINDKKETERWVTAAEIRAILDVEGTRSSLMKFNGNRLGIALAKIAKDSENKRFIKGTRRAGGFKQYLLALDPEVWE